MSDLDKVLLGEEINRAAKFVEYWVKKEKPVLITGDTGTGKSHLANMVGNHLGIGYTEFSCVEANSELFQSNLFGYAKGAFTGAKRDGDPGILGVYKSGVLFLDEIGDLSHESQTSLLRLLQTKKFHKVGGVEDIDTTLQFIAATNKPGNLRPDLRARFKEIDLQRLDLRRDELPCLIHHILKKSQITHVDASVILCLMDCDWKFNYRELESAIESAIAERDLFFKSENTSKSLLKLEHLDSVVRFRYRRWNEKGKPHKKGKSPLNKYKIFKIDSDNFIENCQDMYTQFYKYIGYEKRRTSNPLKESKGPLYRWFQADKKSFEKKKAANNDSKMNVYESHAQLDDSLKDEFIYSILSKMSFNELEKLYCKSLLSRPELRSRAELARIANFSSTRMGRMLKRNNLSIDDRKLD